MKKTIDIIEKAKTYSLQANNYTKTIYVGSRRKLAVILAKINIEDIIVTYGTPRHCIIIVDLELGKLMDIIEQRKYIT